MLVKETFARVARTHARAASRKSRCPFATRKQPNRRFLGPELAHMFAGLHKFGSYRGFI